jgi:hypothetical protein
MRFRKLRITWTVFCAIACLLLISLWARSYWWLDTLQFRAGGGPTTCGIQCYVGRVTVLSFKDQASPSFHLKSDLIVGQVARDVSSITAWERFGLLQRQPGASGVVLPFSALVLTAAVVAAASWLPDRFTLRTLLIVTTLVAVMLGLVAWAGR